MCYSCFLDVNHILQHPLPSGLLGSGPIENFFCFLIISKHAFKLSIDIAMKLEQLIVCDLKNSLGIILAQDFFYLFIQVTHANQVRFLQQFAETALRQRIEKAYILLEFVPKCDCIAFRIYDSVAAPCCVACFWELLLAVRAFGPEEGKRFVALLAYFAFFAG